MSTPHDPKDWQDFVNSIGKAADFLSRKTGEKFQGVIFHQDKNGEPKHTVVPEKPKANGEEN